jgi:hypothetical protein
MRSLAILAATAVVVAQSLPAYAGTYNCEFLNGSSVIQQCTIKAGAAGAGYYCQKGYNATITGLCVVTAASASSDRLQCVYANPNVSVADVTREAAKADPKLATELPGFLAGGVTLGPAAHLVLTAGYRESTSAPVFQVLCVPK